MVQQHERHHPQHGQPRQGDGETRGQRILNPPEPHRAGVMQARQPLDAHIVTVRPMPRAD